VINSGVLLENIGGSQFEKIVREFTWKFNHEPTQTITNHCFNGSQQVRGVREVRGRKKR